MEGTQPLALFPLQTVLFPGMVLPLNVFEDRYLQLMGEVARQEQSFGVILIRQGSEVGEPAVPHAVGTAAHLLRMTPQGSRRLRATVVGTELFRVEEILSEQPLLRARVRYRERVPEEEEPEPELIAEALGCFTSYLRLLCQLADREAQALPKGLDAETLSYVIASTLQVSLLEQQRLLEEWCLKSRLLEELRLLARESQLLAYFASLKERGAGPWRPREGLPGRFSPN